MEKSTLRVDVANSGAISSTSVRQSPSLPISHREDIEQTLPSASLRNRDGMRHHESLRVPIFFESQRPMIVDEDNSEEEMVPERTPLNRIQEHWLTLLTILILLAITVVCSCIEVEVYC